MLNSGQKPSLEARAAMLRACMPRHSLKSVPALLYTSSSYGASQVSATNTRPRGFTDSKKPISNFVFFLSDLNRPIFRFLATKARSSTYFYDCLGLTPKATQKQIKTAYYEASKRYHPDINDSFEAKGKFREISEAYETLGNLTKKRAYDRGLFGTYDDGVAEDVTEDYFRQRDAAFRGRKPPPTGRTAQYDFDEFYRQHYGEQMRAEQRRREYERQRVEYMRHLQVQKMFMRNMLLCFMTFWIGTALVLLIAGERRRFSGSNFKR